MTESVKDIVKRNLEEYRAFYNGVFLPNHLECNHFVPNTPFKAESWTAWRNKGEFEIRTKICSLCGKTLDIETKKVKEG